MIRQTLLLVNSLAFHIREYTGGSYETMDLNEDIVISGISGRYPECNNVEELVEALLKGVDLVTDDERRFPRGSFTVTSSDAPRTDKFFLT